MKHTAKDRVLVPVKYNTDVAKHLDNIALKIAIAMLNETGEYQCKIDGIKHHFYTV